MSKRAVILCGGMGTRLRPYTVVLPKPLMPVGEYPILEVVVRQLNHAGFHHLTLAVNHQAELIKAFFGDGSRWDVIIDYSFEKTPLSTVGPLTLIPNLPEHFLFLNGDVLTDLDFRQFFDAHVLENRAFTIAAARRRQQTDYGVLHVDQASRLTAFEEKPVSDYLVSMGVYAASKALIDGIPAGIRYGFDNLMADMLSRDQTVTVHPHDGYWKDIGRPDDYMQAIDDFESDVRKKLLP